MNEKEILWSIARIPRSEYVDESEQRKLFDTHLEALVEQQVLIGRLKGALGENVVARSLIYGITSREEIPERVYKQLEKRYAELDRQISDLNIKGEA